jgi:peptide/nickel transport system permease protein
LDKFVGVYILRRVFQTLPVLFGISILVFSFLFFIPGDPAIAILGERATPESIARVREQLGLNKPLFLNMPYTYNYICPPDYTGPYFDLVVTMIPNTCVRDVQPKPDWSLWRAQDTDSLTATRIINPGADNQETTTPTELADILRFAGVRTVEQLELAPNESKTYPAPRGTITITRAVETRWVSDLLQSQYIDYMSRILRGDLGNSIQGNISTNQELARRFPATIEVALAALTIATVIGVPMGMLSALRRNSWIDTLSMFLALIGVSLPIFVLGLLMIYLFSVQLGWLPTGLRLDVNLSLIPITGLLIPDAILRGNGDVLGNALRHLIMPSVALSTIPLAIIARITRSAMLEVLHQDYIRTARAKGLHENMVTFRHALRNALLPVVTVIGLQLGSLLSGAVLTETIFSWPGIGKWLLEAISGREYGVVQSLSLVIALVYVLVNLAVDLSYAVLDPRIRYK